MVWHQELLFSFSYATDIRMSAQYLQAIFCNIMFVQERFVFIAFEIESKHVTGNRITFIMKMFLRILNGILCCLLKSGCWLCCIMYCVSSLLYYLFVDLAL
jgi:hypothetical protein